MTELNSSPGGLLWLVAYLVCGALAMGFQFVIHPWLRHARYGAARWSLVCASVVSLWPLFWFFLLRLRPPPKR